MDHNQMALHTDPGCTKIPNSTQTGTNGALDCSIASGCTVSETSLASAGNAFAQAGGGVWATQIEYSGEWLRQLSFFYNS
jgi:hypothetical protein